MLRVAIFNGLPYHYEVFGCIMHWCAKHNHSLVVYTKTERCLGWFDWYEARFKREDGKKLDIRRPEDFIRESHKYHVVFVTTDIDYGFEDRWMGFYNLKDSVVAIDHIREVRRPAIQKHLKIRHYPKEKSQAPMAIYPVYPIHFPGLDRYSDGIHIYLGISVYERRDREVFADMIKKPGFVFHVTGRDALRRTRQLGDGFFHQSNVHIYEDQGTEEMLRLVYQ